MTIREQTEAIEAQILSPYAALSSRSLGRDVPEPQDDLRTCYQRDRDRILHSKAFRRLKHKTQVFLAPAGDHYRTRLTHTLEVSQIARSIARALRLNEDLTEAIALGHDLGHTPFGHAGEKALNEVCPGGFRHYEQSVRVVEVLEKDGRGLNLTREVRDGILNHQMDTLAFTMEGRVVRISDKIAYINHDVDDAITAGLLTENMLPSGVTKILGTTVRDRINTIVNSIVTSSLDGPDVTMEPACAEAVATLRDFMFAHVYRNSRAKEEDDKAQRLLKSLYEYYMEHPDQLPRIYIEAVWERHEPYSRAVCDYIAGMTDDYAIEHYKELFVPRGWQG
ncbi:MAG: deoxyguanosinetriphosphate triphosphohydrolase [Lachnospiraceae bacterium]|nr:deoxyguanosinetriphosphate triphosphohydrolase [Lachnospiraceae bacterium]